MKNRLLWPLAAALLGCTAPPAEERAPGRAPASPPSDTAAVLEIHFLDVGQGDAAVVRSGGRTALVDAGPSDRIVEQLRALGVDTIDLLVASHNHADHIGGADAVLDSFPVRHYLDNGVPAATRIQTRVLERVEREGATYLQPTRRSLALGSAWLRILPPPQGMPEDDQNNRSVGVVVEQGEFQALLTGDSEVEELGGWLAAERLPDVEVLKAAHHGSRNGVSPAWLSRTRPEVVVLSLAADNSYGHPHAAALRYYCAGGRRVYRTDRHGTVRVAVHPSGEYTVRAEREADGGCAGRAGGG